MGDNTIHYEGHVRMMGAVQPFLSGAISKTVNMPEEATVEDVEALHQLSWELGLKAVAIYRDNCKVGQPLSTAKKGDGAAEAAAIVETIVEKVVEKIVHRPLRQKLPRSRRGRTFEFRVADCKGFATIGEYEDGRPGEIFLTVSKQGSTLSGIMDAFAKSISYGLQYGVPLRAFVEAFTNMRFEPAGMTDDPDIRFASSIMDYLFRRLAIEYLSVEERAELSIFTVDERLQPTLPGVDETVIETSTGSEMAADPKSVPSAGELADQLELGTAAPTPGRQHAGRRRDPRPRRADVHAVRRDDDPRRLVPRLPELRQHQRLQLTRAADVGRRSRILVAPATGIADRRASDGTGSQSARTAVSSGLATVGRSGGRRRRTARASQPGSNSELVADDATDPATTRSSSSCARRRGSQVSSPSPSSDGSELPDWCQPPAGRRP